MGIIPEKLIGHPVEHLPTERPAFTPSAQLFQVQGYLAHKKTHSPRALQQGPA